MNTAKLIVRDVCETDPANPDHEESVIVNVRTLEQLIDARLGAIESELSARKEGKITNKMKAECHGEYSWTEESPYYDEDGVLHEEHIVTHEVPWDLCKKIYREMAKHYDHKQALSGC